MALSSAFQPPPSLRDTSPKSATKPSHNYPEFSYGFGGGRREQKPEAGAASLRKRSAVRGEAVVEVKAGDALLGLTEGWAVERFVVVGKKEEKKKTAAKKK